MVAKKTKFSNKKNPRHSENKTFQIKPTHIKQQQVVGMALIEEGPLGGSRVHLKDQYKKGVIGPCTDMGKTTHIQVKITNSNRAIRIDRAIRIANSFIEKSERFRTRWIGANPEKSDLVNFQGPDWSKFSELCVLLFLLGKSDKMLPKSRLSKPIFGHSAGSTKLGRPYCKRFWKIADVEKT